MEMKAFICNSTVLGVAGYRPGLGFINVVFRFHSVAYREKKHRWIRSQIQCPFSCRYKFIFSVRQQCNPWKRTKFIRAVAVLVVQKIWKSSLSHPAVKETSLLKMLEDLYGEGRMWAIKIFFFLYCNANS